MPMFEDDSSGLESNERVRVIQNSIIAIFSRQACRISYPFLYNASHQLVQQSNGQKLFDAVTEAITYCLSYYRDYLSGKADAEFLATLKTVWHDFYYTYLNLTYHLVMPLDKQWRAKQDTAAKGKTSAKPATTGNNTGAPPMTVNETGVAVFGNMLQEKNCMARSRELIITTVRAERNGEEPPHRGLLKELTEMLVTISLDNAYVKCLETQYIDDAKEFFHTESETYFEGSSVVSYLQRVAKRLDEEEMRVDSCLHPTTKPKLMEAIAQVLVIRHTDRIVEKDTGVMDMLKDWRLADLHVVYDVFVRVNNKDRLIEVIGQFCRDCGQRIVRDKSNNDSPLQMVEHLLSLHDQYTDLLNHCTYTLASDGTKKVDTDCKTVVSDAFTFIMNETAGTEHKEPRQAEFLSLYLDQKLKKGKEQVTSDAELHTMIDKVLVLFGHLKQKDVFEKYYKKHLARRLLNSKSANDENEQAFLGKLKEAYGQAFVNHLVHMFNDIKKSEDLQKEWKDAPAQKEVDVSVTVLTHVHWPLQTPKRPIQVSQTVLRTLNAYDDWYCKKHKQRRLQWCYNQGTADIKASFANAAKKYDIVMSTYQMLVVLLFNEQDKWVFSDLADRTGITIEELRRVMVPLSVAPKDKKHSPVLKKKVGPNEKGLGPNTSFMVNDDFKSKQIRVRILPIVTKETAEEVKVTESKIHEERKPMLEAAIVRVMKSRKTLALQQLQIDVVQQVQKRFTPDFKFIKRSIEDLIQRDYLKRDDDQPDLLIYIS
eukprot:TRINITY_DN64328_c0_g1_i1.p1 TRINITY_DN64328_c0_g1~~TRINITY_DN64328_c0_g1_i1.p1  ORF type:complete len:806 (+),score=116.54 TRINITY_DN64328_c0_g1_i1:129-2420(+)